MFARCLSFAVALAALCSTTHADPQATRDDIEISRILNVSRGTLRIAKDPRTNALYTLRQNGSIDRIDLAAAASAPVYSSTDHGIRSGFTGFAIGPDGSFYLASNRRGPRDSGHFALAPRHVARRRHRRATMGTTRPRQPARRHSHRRHSRRHQPRPRSHDRHPLRTQDQRRHSPSYLKARCTQPPTTASVVQVALFIDDAGTFYVLKRIDLSSYNIATITKGEIDPSSGEEWYVFHDKQGRIGLRAEVA